MTSPLKDPHGHTVLVVEDHDDGRTSLALLLEVQGYEVVSASNGEEAIGLLAKSTLRPCAIILDLIMPKIDGFTFRHWQQQSPELAAIPVIALTGHEGLRRQAMADGFAAALLKPVGIEVIDALLGKHCRGRKT
jgi:CheY-like chemotaxis protein